MQSHLAISLPLRIVLQAVLHRLAIQLRVRALEQADSVRAGHVLCRMNG